MGDAVQGSRRSRDPSALDRAAFSATIHCLTGCAIGQVLAMVVATGLGCAQQRSRSRACTPRSLRCAACSGYDCRPYGRLDPRAVWGKPTHRFCRDFADGPGRNRTCDLGIKSPLLYQLSYRPRQASVDMLRS